MAIRRTHRWEGCVEELDADTLWVRLIPTDHKGPELRAEIDRCRLPDAQPGSIFNLYTHVRGKKVRTVIRLKTLPVWTAEELAEIEARAQERSQEKS